ncbi:DNA alkylation response protein [Saccharospirillum sp. MSK14-1]|uniref:isovaleryl-CoA dehydrogenase n=1 Tax=Saccharospirillum sp. MSK14-1 TaxID=1897632 RepID=UPI000D338016|nr:isovaleryl-CoA dehydrogenase [Saccharospirillum sp. MSK14-1]PTY37745.1 DNA alkylation response protein [Saccharospirillum sp. MSK14-1]
MSDAPFKRDQHLANADTHDVINQPTPLANYNLYRSDNALQHWSHHFGAGWAEDRLNDYGQRAGGDLIEAGFQANEVPPTFHSHDRFGHRIDEVRFHPAYHELMRTAVEASIPALPWRTPKPGAHVARAGLEYLHMHAEAGSACPLTMTFAAVPAIATTPEVADLWLPKITAPVYDPRNVPFYEKDGLTIGMAMTEKQGGSDVRANTTRAYPLGKRQPGERYELIGHKWFCSAPMCDAFLVLAQTENGLSCFLMPRWRDDGQKNAFFIQRLKDKLGNRSNASSEIEFRGAHAWLLGEEGKGVRTIIEMVAMTRFDCLVGSAALMRAATAQALHHTSGRSAFGQPLHDMPLMQNVLADLSIESEAALAMSLRVGRALDHSASDESEQLLARLATAVGKYWVCKRTPHLTYEAMECIGGVGYVEENILPRLYREAPVNAIWEGSGNIQCLDVLRAIGRDPKTLDALLADIEKAQSHSKSFDRALLELKQQFSNTEQLEYRARTLVDKLAMTFQASILLRDGDPRVAEAFVESRLNPNGAFNYGTLEPGVDCSKIIERAMPVV